MSRLLHPNHPLISYEDKKFYEKVYLADADFFELIAFPWIHGDRQSALREPYSMVISAAIAEKYFGEENPINKVITWDDTHEYRITGVFDLPTNTHFPCHWVASANLWFGTFRGGVSRYDGNSLTTFTEEDGLADNNVYTILEDQKGNLWFNRDVTWRRHSYERSEHWEGKGISRYDGQQFNTFTKAEGLADDDVACMLEDREGNLWFGTLDGGVSRYDGEQFTTFTVEDGLADNWVDKMLEDREGNLWFGTNGGVSRYDGESFTTFTEENGLADNYVQCMLEDGAGNLWFGAESGDVSRYNGKQFVTFSTRESLVKDVSFMLESQEGNLWFGCRNQGVVQYDGVVFQRLLKYDGLVNYSINQLLQARNGDIWIATIDGITRYRPQSISPSIFLTDVRADRKYGPIQEIRISSSQQFIIFEFQGLSFKTRSGQIVYLYQLSEFEKEWQQTRENYVEYTDLPVGEYEFQVKAVDRDLNYSKEPATVKVIVHPPYDQVALWGSLGVAIIGLFFASGYGIKRNRERNRAREESARAQQERLELQEQLNQELEEELQTAHDMQMGLMPTASPKIQGFDITGRCIPANHVGGDFFQYFPISDNRLAISLADVTGHAMEAAVPVMMFSGILDTQMETEDSVENLFPKLNRSLCRNLADRRTYVCFTMGELDTSTKKFRLSNGGCPYPYHYQAATGEITELQVDAYPLGVRAETIYRVIETQLEPGDRIVFCSDGIIEAENSDGEIFGFEQTAETIRNGCTKDLSAPQLLDYLINEVKTFTGETPQGDDQTVVVLAVEA